MIDQSAKDELMQLIDMRSRALVEGDPEFFEQFLANDFSYTNAGGKVFDKTAYLEFFIKSKQIQWQSQKLDDLIIRCHGDMAVITCRIYDRASYQGEAFEGYFRSMQVFLKQSNGWQYIAGQTTTVES